LKALSAAGDPLERLAKVVDFEVFRGELEADRIMEMSDAEIGLKALLGQPGGVSTYGQILDTQREQLSSFGQQAAPEHPNYQPLFLTSSYKIDDAACSCSHRC
jgi:hypothetical protein